jgi:hypothetical protein
MHIKVLFIDEIFQINSTTELKMTILFLLPSCQIAAYVHESKHELARYGLLFYAGSITSP